MVTGFLFIILRPIPERTKIRNMQAIIILLYNEIVKFQIWPPKKGLTKKTKVTEVNQAFRAGGARQHRERERCCWDSKEMDLTLQQKCHWSQNREITIVGDLLCKVPLMELLIRFLWNLNPKLCRRQLLPLHMKMFSSIFYQQIPCSFIKTNSWLLKCP